MRLEFTGLWRHSDFMKLWTGETISLFGSQITAFALPLIAALILQATPAQMGILGAVQFAPFLLFSLFAGVWVDRLRRRPIMILSNTGRALLIFSIPIAHLLNVLSIEYLYVAAFIIGILTVFFDVAYQAYLPSLVGRTQLVEGNAKLEVSRSLAQILGPGLSGALVQIISAPLTLVLDAGSFVVSAVSLLAIQQHDIVETSPGQRKNIWHEIREGLHIVFSNPILRSIAGCTSTSNLFGTMGQAVFTLYVLRELHFDPGLLGAIFSISSIGALLGALLAGSVAKRFGLGRTIVGTALMFGIGALFVPLASGSYWLTAIMVTTGLFFGNLANPIYNINQVSLRQVITPFKLQGRMNASMRFLVWGTIPLGSLLGGVLGEVIGLRSTLMLAAIGSCLSFVWVFLSPVVALHKPPAIEVQPEDEPVLTQA